MIKNKKLLDISKSDYVWNLTDIYFLKNEMKEGRLSKDFFNVEFIKKNASLNKDFWHLVMYWWELNPSEFNLFWADFLKSPRNEWSESSLSCIDIFRKGLGVKNDVYISKLLLSNAGRYWLLRHPDYKSVLLYYIDDAILYEWCKSTSYSLSHLTLSFMTLSLLVGLGFDKNKIIKVLETIPDTIKTHSNKNVIKAWGLTTFELNLWMDSDTTLAPWFDPVNEVLWQQEFDFFKNS